MVNRKVSAIFNEIADILEIRGDNPFRIRAYRRAARTIEGLSRDLASMRPEEIRGLPGIGADLADKISEFLASGRVEVHERLKAGIPEGLLEILSVPGLGPKTAAVLHERLGVESLEDLEKAASAGRLSGLPGIKAKTEQNILKGIKMIKRHTGRFPIGTALPLAEEIKSCLEKMASVEKVAIAGSLRRWKETVKDIDILAVSGDPEAVMDAFAAMPLVREVTAKGPAKTSVVTDTGLHVDLRVVAEESFGAALAYFTGSKEHNVRLREIAMKKGLKINEYGVFRVSDDRKLGGEREEDIYDAIGLPYIPAEMREDRGEVEAALSGSLPDLVTMDDIKGDLHVHTKYSDGAHDIDELVKMAKKRGYRYIAITDHSKGLGVARGLQVDDLLQQVKRVRTLNRKLRGFTLLAGTEVDVRSDGTLDYPDEVLRHLDIVVASIHSGFRQSRRQLTRRLVAAARNPYVSVIAHPTGRLIGQREAYDIDIQEVLKAAAETNTVLEVNAYPARLDLNDINIKMAIESKVMMAVNTDAHSEPHLDFMRYGVGMLRRGWAGASAVLNTMNLPALRKRLRMNLP